MLDFKYNNCNLISKKVVISDNKANIKSENFDKPKDNYTFYDYIKSFFHTINIFRIFNCCERKKNNVDEEYINASLDINKENPKLYIENQFKEKEISKIVFLPKILIISFVRGLEGQNLITSSIRFEEELDLKDYVEKDLFDGNIGTKYKLFAINIRQGYTKTSGHCYSYVKVKNEWICYNDSDARPEKPSFNLNKVAGLYYIKKDIYDI